MSDSLGPHGVHSARLPCLWNFPGKNIKWAVISFSLSQEATGEKLYDNEEKRRDLERGEVKEITFPGM